MPKSGGGRQQQHESLDSFDSSDSSESESELELSETTISSKKRTPSQLPVPSDAFVVRDNSTPAFTPKKKRKSVAETPSTNASAESDNFDDETIMDQIDADSMSSETTPSISLVLLNIESRESLVSERDAFFDRAQTAVEVIAFIKRFPPSPKRVGITQMIKAIKNNVNKHFPNTFKEPADKKQHQQKQIQSQFFAELQTFLSLHQQTRAQVVKAAIGAQINLYISNEFKHSDSAARGPAVSSKDYLNKVAKFAHLVTATGALSLFVSSHLPVDPNLKVAVLNDPDGRKAHKIKAYEDLAAFSISQEFKDHAEEEYARKVNQTELTTEIFNFIEDISWSDGDLDADFVEKMLQAKFMNSYREVFGLQVGNEQSRMGRSGSNHAPGTVENKVDGWRYVGHDFKNLALYYCFVIWDNEDINHISRSLSVLGTSSTSDARSTIDVRSNKKKDEDKKSQELQKEQAAYFRQRTENEKIEAGLKVVAMTNSTKQELLNSLQGQITFLNQQWSEATDSDTKARWKAALDKVTNKYMDHIC